MSGGGGVEGLGLLGTPVREIDLVTHLGRRIPNYVAPPPSARVAATRLHVAQKHGKRWELRLNPCGVYNCGGHVWASRRTALEPDFEDPELDTFEKVVDRILEDDGWTERVEVPKPGDLALYWLPNEPRAIFLHVGIVVRIDSPKDFNQIWVLSKWDDSSGEYVHAAGDIGHWREQFGSGVFWEFRRNVVRGDR